MAPESRNEKKDVYDKRRNNRKVSRNKFQAKYTYTEEQLQEAIKEVRGGTSKKHAALKYGIPRSTIQFRLGKKFTKIEKGRNTYLTKNEEKKLVDWIIENDRKGFPRRQVDLQAAVKSFLDADVRPNPFKNNLPGNRWYTLFIKRHPELVERTPEGVTGASANVSEKDIKGWFRDIEEYLKRKNLLSILENPSRVYNGDETCFQFCPKLGKVIAPKGKKNVYEIDQGNAKQNLTVMFTFSATGVITPPMIIYPNKRLPKNILEGIPDSWGIGLTENGWMKSEVFVDYIKNVLYPSLKTTVEFLIILFVDGHTTHLSLELSDACTELQIVLIALYPNSTRLLQPADVASFKPLKHMWKKSVLEWRRKNPYCNLTKQHFAPILKDALEHLKPTSVISGFKACGLYPWNMNALDYSKCLGKKESIPSTQEIDNPSDKLHEKLLELFDETLKTEIKRNMRTKCTSEHCKYFKTLQEIYSKLEPSSIDNMEIFTANEIEQMPIIIHEDINNQFIEESTKIDNLESEFVVTENCSLEVEESNLLDSFDVNQNNSSNTIMETEINNDLANISNIMSTTEQVLISMEIATNNDEANVNNIMSTSEREGLMSIDTATSNDVVNISNIMSTSEQEVLMAMLNEDNLDKIEEQCNVPIIENYLSVPQTPVRKGIRQTERVSFVLTSSVYKSNALEKEKEKEEKERKKQENKQKRMLKAIENKHITPKRNCTKKTKAVSKQTSNKLSHVRNLKNILDEPVLVIPRANTVSTTITNTDSVTETKGKSNVKQPYSNNEAYIPKNNIVASKGLCFYCTKNLYMTDIGIKCQKCTRAYHVKCLKKQHLYKEFYLCKVCTEKKNYVNSG